MANVTFKNISFRYGSNQILKDFSLEIADGEIVYCEGPRIVPQPEEMAEGAEELAEGDTETVDTFAEAAESMPEEI